MRNLEVRPQMTRVGIPDEKPEKREVPFAPPLPGREPVRSPAVPPAPVRTPELVPAGVAGR